MKQYEYQIIVGFTEYRCNNNKELCEVIKALSFRQPMLTASVARRIKEPGVYGSAWCICHTDLRIKLPMWHVGPYADSAYMVGNGTVVVGFDRAVAVVAEQGLFTIDEAQSYVLAISQYRV